MQNDCGTTSHFGWRVLNVMDALNSLDAINSPPYCVAISQKVYFLGTDVNKVFVKTKVEGAL